MNINFEFLENWNFEKALPESIRTNTIIRKYNNYNLYLKKNNINKDKYIIEKYLSDSKYSIVKNRFPYNIDSNMQHYVLWIHPYYFNKISNKEICLIIINKMKEINYDEYFCFENHINAKSILGVPHFQVFYKKC